MIDYAPFWEMKEKRGISTYQLIHEYRISPSIINRLRHNQYISLYILEKLCKIYGCEMKDIVVIVDDEEADHEELVKKTDDE